MSDETLGAGQGALPPREGIRQATTRVTQVGSGQYLLTTQTTPSSFTQIGSTNLTTQQCGVTRIVSISPARSGQISPLRPSLSNQSIVDALKKSRPNANVRLQLFPTGETIATSRTPLKRSLPPTPEKKDNYAAKLQRVMNHRNVRSKILKEKYNDNLLESFHLDMGGNILDLYQFAKRPKTQQYISYVKENSIDPKDNVPEVTNTIKATTTPAITTTATTASLPSKSTTPLETNSMETTLENAIPKNSTNKIKTPNTPCVNGSNQEQIVEKAKQEAYVVQRINDLQKEGLWSEKRLPKVQEIPRIKTHWDFLLEEMVWLAADFAQERKWKKAAAKKCARMVQKYFQDKALAAQRAEKAHEQHIRRLAAFCAKEIKTFWGNVEKLVEYKQNTRLEEKRKKALDQQLSFIVDQTEKYSRLLAEGMNKYENTPVESPNSMEVGDKTMSDDEFRPNSEVSSDDEETIEQEEAVGSQEQSEEIAALKRESQMDLEDFLNELPKDYLENRDKIKLSDEENSDDEIVEKASTKDDEEFKVDSSSDDDEDTIQEQETAEGSQDHEEEINDLNAEAEMDIEELRRKYSGLPPSVEDEDSRMSAESTLNSENDNDLSESQDETENDLSEEEEEVKDSTEVGLKSLLDDSKEGDETKTDNNTLINDAAAIAESIQPKGNTLSSTQVVTPIPHLLKYPLREYQHIGLDWLVTMFERKLNGILADEMGLGKTIQTIALLAHLACEKENWGPHLIVVPTSVMLNWEMECKKWCPAFKILTYYGSQKERKLKRTGWTKPNAFHICITSYKLVIQDHQSFRRKKWKYLILDEAQNIKNFKSQRWQLLLNFQTQQRLLLTGTPLQNNLMELWSLMHFLMPNVFQSHREFKEWFSNPVTGMIEGNSEYNENIIKRLHKVLRPFLLRRLKCEVEKQMPRKYEHVVMCRLSKRQRFLYDDYMSRAKTKEVLAGGNLLHVINVLMQLRKVCNHPNLFEVRPTVSPFRCEGVIAHIPSVIYSLLEYDIWNHVNLESLNLDFVKLELSNSSYQCYRLRQYCAPRKLIEELDVISSDLSPFCPPSRLSLKVHRHKPVKSEPELPPNHSQKMKFLPTPRGLQLTNSANQNLNTSVNLSTVLKPSVPGYAQLVQTSTGKHILLTPTCNLNANSIGLSNTTTVMTSSGQRLTVFSKQPVQTSNAPAMAKAVVKVQLTSISPTSPMNSVPNEKEEKKTVGTKFIDKLYTNTSSKSKSLDVRWPYDFNQEINNCDSKEDTKNHKLSNIESFVRINNTRCNALPIYGKDFIGKMEMMSLASKIPWVNGRKHCLDVQYSKSIGTCLSDMIYTPDKIVNNLSDIFNRYLVYVPAAQAPEAVMQVSNPDPSIYWGHVNKKTTLVQELAEPTEILHTIATYMTTQFPHPRLIQYDCGKLQTLDVLLRKLKYGGHRVLIFTQMTKMLDVLEAFLNFHGHIYLRLDGSTKIDQRQILMERFNGDTRIFVFILSTRSGGVGVNLTGADTVIFYDSDWNPTMDAQAQDRCHRIGQTRDVHIYRLVSEMTIEENILKKANQKRLLGDLAIEGGNFTTAYFKSTTIQDLFKVDSNENKEKPVEKMDVVIEDVNESNVNVPTNEEKLAIGNLESLLATSEDDQDVKAACSAKAEAVADLAEFDENIPIEEQEREKEPEISKAEQEVEHLIKQLTPIEKYAMRFIEETEAAWSAEQLAAAEREIEEKKREWEENRIAAMHEENERRKRELEEESEILTFSREDATNQMWISESTKEEMPMWCPPTPPQQDTDIYLDVNTSFLYHSNLMGESELPPVYVKKELKRTRNEAGLVETRRALKIQRKDECAFPPRSIFERSSPALIKIRRDLKMQKYRGLIRTTPLAVKFVTSNKPAVDPPCLHNWIIHEDMALLKVIQNYQGLNLTYTCAGHTPNWEFVADYVNTVSITYRSPKQCRLRYETVLVPREEGKQVIDNSPRKKKQKTSLPKYSPPIKSSRSLRTSQLFNQDNNSAFSQLLIQRHDSLKSLNVKKPTVPKTIINSPVLKNPKHASVLSEAGIDLDTPVLPVEVAARRAERVAREKKTITPEQLATAQKLHLLRVQASAAITSSPSTTTGQSTQSQSTPQVVTTPSTPTGQIRMQRIVASPLQTSTVVSMSGVSPAQLQAATQRIIVSGSPVQAKATVVGSAATVPGKTISPAQLHLIRTAASMKQQQLRLQSGVAPQGIKSTTVTLAGQTAVQVHFTQAQATRTQYIKQAGVTVAGKQGIARAVTESEMALLLKRQQQIQQQKALAAAVVSQSQIQSVAPQVLAQAIQAGASGQVATLVKAVPTSGVNQTVIGGQMKPLQQGSKQAAQQLRALQIQQQLLAQKKLPNQKIAGIAQVTGKGGIQTQLIVGPKPLPTAMTMQQFQQVIRSPLNVPQGPVVLAKAPRVIPVNSASGSKPTIQVVAASSQGITTTIRSQTSSTLAGALAGIKVQGGSQAQNAILSQVTAALQGQNVRQSSPVRLQSANGNPIVAVTVQSTLPGSSAQSMNDKDHA